MQRKSWYLEEVQLLLIVNLKYSVSPSSATLFGKAEITDTAGLSTLQTEHTATSSGGQQLKRAKNHQPESLPTFLQRTFSPASIISSSDNPRVVRKFFLISSRIQ